jgi:hypothetical protein
VIYFGEDKMPDFCNRRFPFHYTTALNLLAKMGIDSMRVHIIAIGEYENYKGEVLAQEPKPGAAIAADTRLVLSVGCWSAVDQLPYQFFYGLQGGVHRGGEWEVKARHFMAPYDAAVVRHEATARYQALKYDFGIIDADHLTRYLNLFDFQQERDTRDLREALLWAALLPSFHFWAGNPGRVADVLTLLFGYRFRIVENSYSSYEIPSAVHYRLGARAGRLGRESIVGRTFSECDSSYKVIIGGIRREEVVEFLPGRPRRKKLEWVLNICMPSDLDYCIVFEVENKGLKPGKDNRCAFLGYATHL